MIYSGRVQLQAVGPGVCLTELKEKKKHACIAVPLINFSANLLCIECSSSLNVGSAVAKITFSLIRNVAAVAKMRMRAPVQYSSVLLYITNAVQFRNFTCYKVLCPVEYYPVLYFTVDRPPVLSLKSLAALAFCRTL